MVKTKPNYAFIDSQNLNLGVRSLGWKIDFKRFRVYLREKYNVDKAYIFIGYIAKNDDMYAAFKNYGYTCIFRPTLTNKDGTTKGNCDAELVLHAMIEHNKLGILLVPNQKKFSALLKYDIFKPHTRFVSDLRFKIEYSRNKKNPRKDETLKGQSSVGNIKNIPSHKRNVNKK